MIEQLISLLQYAIPIGYKYSAGELSAGLEITERQLRSLVEEIRRDDLIKGYVLVSGDEGYYLSDDAEEINKFLRRYLGSAFSVIKTAQNAKKFLSEQQVKGIQTELQF